MVNSGLLKRSAHELLIGSLVFNKQYDMHRDSSCYLKQKCSALTVVGAWWSAEVWLHATPTVLFKHDASMMAFFLP